MNAIYTPKGAVTTETRGLIARSLEELEEKGFDALKGATVDALVDLFNVKFGGDGISFTQDEFFAREWDELERELLNRLYFFNVLKFARVTRMNNFQPQYIFVTNKEYANRR
jgi:hypothetical protein